MPTKKERLQDKLHKGEAVDTQAIAHEIEQEIAAPKAQPAKAAGFVVVKEFEYDNEQYKEGDEFIPPKNWVRDLSFDEFRGSERKNKEAELFGVAFIVPGEILNKKTGERAYFRQILPIKEA